MPESVMQCLRARIHVRLKKEVLDPQGKAILAGLRQLGFGEVRDARAGKVFDLEIEGSNRAEAGERLRQMAEKLLANTVIESYSIEIADESADDESGSASR